MAAENEGRYVFDRYAELFRQETSETRRIQNTGHADHFVRRQTRSALQNANHHIERVGDADHKGVRAIFLDAFADRFHNAGVNADKVVATHARLARNTRRDDYDISTLDSGVGIRALYGSVEPFNRRALRNIQRLALRNTIDDVEQSDVAKILQPRKQCKRTTDISRADKRNFITCH